MKFGGLKLDQCNLDINTLENWLWEAACKIRGDIDAPKYKDYILPLIFIKRLSDVFDDELKKLNDDYGSQEVAEQLLIEDHSLVRFYIPPDSRWGAISKKSTGLGEFLTDAVRSIARENPKVQGVIDVVDFNATAAGQRIIPDEKLKALVDVLGRYRLGLADVEPDILGRAYEYLLRKFAEGSGSSAGEFYTPREVAMLMAEILDPKPGEEVYDPCCGSGGLLIKCHLHFINKYHEDPSVAPIRSYGQELLHSTYAMAKMNIFIHDMEAQIKLGDTMIRPAFLNHDSSLQKFNIVTANPMWNQVFPAGTYNDDPYERFDLGLPYDSNADWGWVQHMYASLQENGRMAVVLDTGAVSRGSGNTGRSRELDIRKEFIDEDLVEAVVLLPENLFYNTTAPGIILIINNQKSHVDEIMLINAYQLFEKGSPKNYISSESISTISKIYFQWNEQKGISRILNRQEISENDYSLNPSRYVVQDSEENVMPLQDAIILLNEVEDERKIIDKNLKNLLTELGLK